MILFGEHAVVHGAPALALPIDGLGVCATARLLDDVDDVDDVEGSAAPAASDVERRPGESTIVTDVYSGPLDGAPELLESPRAVILACLEEFGLSGSGVEVTVTGEVPHARGLGSSAAVAGAIVRALADLAGAELSQELYLDLVGVGEKVAHGAPSGLDAHATAAAEPIIFEAGVARVLPHRTRAVIVVADSGVAGRTRRAVASVTSFLERHPLRGPALMAGLGALAQQGALDLAQGRPEQLGAKMAEAQGMLRELGVSSPELDRIVDAAVGAGAYGAKLTGGGQGGCVIALAADDEAARRVATAMRLAGAVATWQHRLEGSS